MKRLVILVSLVFGLLAAVPAVSLGGKGGIGTEDTCAASISFGTEDAGACGGTITWRYVGKVNGNCRYQGYYENGYPTPWWMDQAPYPNGSCPSQPRF